MSPETGLLSLQRAFLAALRTPLFGDGRSRTALVARAGEPAPSYVATAARHLRPSSTLEPVQRLELYHRQYWYRVLDSLEEDFPALKRLMGERRFWDVVEAYLEATPSRSGTLRHLGSQFPDFLASREARLGPSAVAFVEVARLEYALCLAFEAGEEDPVPAERLEGTRLALQPHVQLFELHTPAEVLWSRAVAGEDCSELLLAAAPDAPNDVTADATGSVVALAPRHHVVVFRDRFDPVMERVDLEAWRLLSAIHRGATLARAIDSSGLDSTPEDAARLQAWFSQWTSRGWLRPAAPPS